MRTVDFFFRDMSEHFFLSPGGLWEEVGFEGRDGVFRGGLTCSGMQRGANSALKAEGRVLFFLGGDFVDRSGGIGCVKTVSQNRDDTCLPRLNLT